MSKNFQDAVPYPDLLDEWGFEPSIFDADEARKEKRLEAVMEKPEWYLEVLGTVNRLDYVIITGPRGSGKSAIRRSIADHCRTELGNDLLGGRALCISLDHDLPNWVKNIKNESISPVDSICDELIDQLFVAVMTYCEPDFLKDVLEKNELSIIERYSHRLVKKHPDDIRVIAEKLQSAKTKIRNSDLLNQLVKIITSTLGNTATIDPEIIKTVPIDDIQSVIHIVKKCGFDAIYVLLDEIDEFDETNGKPQLAAEIIVPILSCINLLEKECIGFKFFLSAPVFYRLKQTSHQLKMEIRSDRVLNPRPFVLAWDDTDIQKMLRKRIMAYSYNKYNSLQTFCDFNSEVLDIDSLIVRFAYRNPRHMIQLCNRIVTHCARRANAIGKKITLQVVESALFEFCDNNCMSIYEEPHLDALKEFGSKIIKDSIFAERNDVNIEKAREVLDELVQLDALTVKENIKKEKTYTIVDPKILLLAKKTTIYKNKVIRK